ncbi:peroxidase family protein [Nonomuraea sp. NPDC050643]|uniref:peroxidase family protein n=1 Tax=Nonomuraea sp. NPDC050643 TaxID=3155660 RepID=UPI0033C0FED1
MRRTWSHPTGHTVPGAPPTFENTVTHWWDGGDLESVDTSVGLLAGAEPAGFALSDSAFRIFVLMASRRLKSDPFFTDLHTAEIYSPEGLDWIDRTGMTEVLRRHHPELAPALSGVRNAFAPWREFS